MQSGLDTFSVLTKKVGMNLRSELHHASHFINGSIYGSIFFVKQTSGSCRGSLRYSQIAKLSHSGQPSRNAQADLSAYFFVMCIKVHFFHRKWLIESVDLFRRLTLTDKDFILNHMLKTTMAQNDGHRSVQSDPNVHRRHVPTF